MPLSKREDSNVIPTELQAAVRELEQGLELVWTASCQRKPVEAQLLVSLGKSPSCQSKLLATSFPRAKMADPGDEVEHSK